MNMTVITEGNHLWNLNPQVEGERREYPKCRGRIIKEERCVRCGYSPKDKEERNDDRRY